MDVKMTTGNYSQQWQQSTVEYSKKYSPLKLRKHTNTPHVSSKTNTVTC